MAIDGAEITSDLPTARPKSFFGGCGLARHVRARRRSFAAAGLHLLLQTRGRPQASLRRLLARIDFIAPTLCLRLGVPLPYDTGEPGGGNRRSTSLRPRAGCGSLFLDHARPNPELQIWDRHEGACLGGGLRLPAANFSPMPM
jgi:hypothetical protein